jgi:hypothetical protein
VTSAAKLIGGVTCLVVKDTVVADDVDIEDTETATPRTSMGLPGTAAKSR